MVKLPDGREVLHYSGMDYQALVAIADALNFSAKVIPTASFEEVCLWWFELNLPLFFHFGKYRISLGLILFSRLYMHIYIANNYNLQSFYSAKQCTS